MKITKRLLPLVLVLVAVFAFGAVGVSAADESCSITVSNAMSETTYTLYKAFDATYTVDGNNTIVSYTLNAPSTDTKATALLTAIQGSDSPFTAKKRGTTGSIYEITPKDNTTDEDILTFIEGQKANLAVVTTKACAVNATQVVFDGLTPGYYLVYAKDKGVSDDGSAVTVTTAAPDAIVIDKNTRTPSDVEKEAGVFSAQIGEDVPFTVSFKAVNFRTAEGADGNDDTNRIMSYTLTDTATDLAYKNGGNTSVFGDTAGTVKIYQTKNQDGTFSNELTVGGTTGYPPIESSYDTATHTLTIFWGDSETSSGTTSSRYPANVYVVVTYNMIMTEARAASNTITAKMVLDGVASPEEIGEASDIVKSAFVAIEKVAADDTNKKLTGAKFILSKTDNNVTTYWTYDAINDKVVWVSTEADAQVVTADNDAATSEFYGLKAGTYQIKEIEPPIGYKLPGSDFTLVVADDAVNDALTVTLDEAPLSADNGIFACTITNSKAGSLPSTGGIGTKIFYTVGVLLLVAALAAFVVRRRAAKND